jgi:hypothetical protein
MSNDWRTELTKIIDKKPRATRAELESARVAAFIEDVVLPAYKELADELAKHERKVTIRQTAVSATIAVYLNDIEEITYRILSRSLSAGIVPYAEVRMRKGQRLVKAEGNIKGTGAASTVEQVTPAEVLANFLSYYRTAMDAGQAG